MTLRFVHTIPLGTEAFEECYEEGLRLDPDERAAILDISDNATWLLVDGKLAGETYGVTPADLKARTGQLIEDCDPEDANTVYCYSMTILPEFQGKGLATILKANWLGQLAIMGRHKVCGHATTEAALKLNQKFGAVIQSTHPNWCGTPRTAHFYTIDL